MANKSVFRHTFSKQFVEVLNEFSKTHQQDERKCFKAEWDIWISKLEIQSLINEETKQLRNDGFHGDVMDKMFKSCRYYFRNKEDKDDDSVLKKERKAYVSLPKSVLVHMDDHIQTQIGVRPENAYNNYCNEYTAKIKSEIESFSETIGDSVEAIYLKYKKTYKNRVYVLSKK